MKKLLGIIAAAALVFVFSVRAEAVWPTKMLKKIEGATYVGSETCGDCHEDRHRGFDMTSHARLNVQDESGEVVQGCETCHGPGSVHVDNGGGKGTMINPKNDPQACFTCHMDKKAEFMLPYRHPVLEGKMSCTDCHDVHGSDLRPWTTTSFDGVNDTCFKCHKEQRGPFIFEHEALKEGCTTCHKVHGAIHDKMLLIRDNNLCLRCHAQADFPNIGDSGHGGRLPTGTCFSAGCHTAMHGSNFDDHLRY